MAQNTKLLSTSDAARLIGCSTATASRWAERLGLGQMVGAVKALTPEEVKVIEQKWQKRRGNPNFRKN